MNNRTAKKLNKNARKVGIKAKVLKRAWYSLSEPEKVKIKPTLIFAIDVKREIANRNKYLKPEGKSQKASRARKDVNRLEQKPSVYMRFIAFWIRIFQGWEASYKYLHPKKAGVKA